MQLTTTLRLLRKYRACAAGYEKLATALGPGWPDNKQIPLARILETNGLDDCLWAMRSVPKAQQRDRDRIARLFACWCVRQVWHLLTDERSRRAVEVAEKFAAGDATEEELDAAWDAAWDAARFAAWDAAWDAARAAARSAALDAALDAQRTELARALGEG